MAFVSSILSSNKKGQSSIAESNTQISVDAFAFGKTHSMQKGQLSIEFILILLVVLILIETIVLPLRDYAEGSVQDVISTQTLEKGLLDLDYSVKSLQSYSSGKLNVIVKVPENTTLFFRPTGPDLEIGYTVTMQAKDENVDYKNCTDSVCNKKIVLSSVSGLAKTFVGPAEADLSVEKSNNKITISVK